MCISTTKIVLRGEFINACRSTVPEVHCLKQKKSFCLTSSPARHHDMLWLRGSESHRDICSWEPMKMLYFIRFRKNYANMIGRWTHKCVENSLSKTSAHQSEVGSFYRPFWAIRASCEASGQMWQTCQTLAFLQLCTLSPHAVVCPVSFRKWLPTPYWVQCL